MDDEIKISGKNQYDDFEKISFGILSASLGRTRRAVADPLPEKKENFDGHISFYDENHKPLFVKDENGTQISLRTPKYQLKHSCNENFFDCEMTFLTACFFDPDPIFLILVDVEKNIIYYECISKSYIINELKITDVRLEKRKQKRIKFTKIFSTNIDDLINSYLSEEKRLKNLSEYSYPAEPQEVMDHKKSIRGLTGKDDLAIFDLEALLFFHFPVKESSKEIDHIRNKLKISKVSLDYMIEKLDTVGAVKIVGNIFTITNVPISQALLNDLVERNGVEYLYE